jgi:hypothetical protein
VRTSFADGNWTGSGRLHQVIRGVALTGSATFTMKVRGGRVTGMMSTIGIARGKYEDVSVLAELSGRYPLSGRASAPIARGTLRASAVVQGKRRSGSGPVILSLTGLRGSCDQMTGWIVLRAAQPDPNAEGPSSLSAAFAAVRASGSGPRC